MIVIKKRILIFGIYPAPYRVNLFERFYEKYDCDIFFLQSGGDERNEKWFTKSRYYTLDSIEGDKKYRNTDIKSYDLVVFYEYSMTEAIKLILECRIKCVPYIINCDGVMLTEHGNIIKDILKKILISGAVGYLASGEMAKKYFKKYGAKDGSIYIHGFTTLNESDILKEPSSHSEKETIRERLGLPKSAKIAIAVGRFIKLKRYNELISEWKNMPRDYYLLLVGGGEEEETYRKTIKELGLGNIIIEKFHPKEELFDYYKASDIFVHPTSYDVWGLVVNEAMACGLPVVVSDHCVAGLELIKNGKNGYLIPMGNDDELCDKVRLVLSDEQNYNNMSHSVLNTIRPYTMENMANKHMEVFDKILSKR